MILRLPNMWGGGQLFAFSGLEGQTSWAAPFVGSLLDEGLAVDFHQSPPVVLEVTGPEAQVLEVKPEWVIGDAFEVAVSWPTGSGRVVAAFADCWTLVGRASEGLQVRLREVADQPDQRHLQASGNFALVRGEQGVWVLALDPEGPEAAHTRALEALRLDSAVVADERLAFVEELEVGEILPPADERTYRKAASVLKTNVMAPEGTIGRRWTTPDRWPHRHMWLWDSCFHALGWLYLDSQLAMDAVEAMVESAYPDGMIPLCSAPTPAPYKLSQPPLLAWTVWELHQATGDVDFPVRVYDGLAGYVRWFLNERDRNHNGLLDWFKQDEDKLCHCGESGLDNSPRFDQPGIDDHVDLSCMIYNEMECLARIAFIGDRFDEAAEWREQAQKLAAAINERMWDEETGFYYDVRADGELLKMKTVVGFLPMWAGIASEERLGRLMAHLLDPREFATEFPIPTVALDEPSFTDDMWRGPTWINMNYLIFRGLMRNGLMAEANDLRAATLRQIARWYGSEGSIYEYYDCFAKTAPRKLHRKGGVGGQGGYGVGTIADYGWSAALYVALANEGIE
ncbi:MAG: trehalase family glycosidase [Armatimonadia bacterium]